MKLEKLINKIEHFYPKSLKEDWDNVGLQLGNSDKEVKRVLTALEITNDVIDEAIEYKMDLIVAHHPLIFKKIDTLDERNPQNKKIIKLIKNNIAVYILHTNIDIANNGINDWISETLDMKVDTYLDKTDEYNMYEIQLKIEMENIDLILDALPKYGFGRGKKDNDEQYLMYPKVKTYRDYKTKMMKTKDITVIETQGSKEQINAFKKYLYKIKIDKKVYTKMSYYKIEDYKFNIGIGRIGYIKPMSLEMLAEKVKGTFKLDHVRIVGSREKILKKIAIVGGSGGSYVQIAKNRGCDVLVTGDISFHDAQLALDLGICLIDAGHYLEIVFNDGMEKFLQLIDNIEVMGSRINTNPIEVV